MRFCVGRFEFASKAAAENAVRSMYRRYAFGERLQGEDFEFMLALARNHVHFKAKAGSGVRGFRIEADSRTGHPYCVLERVDGSETDISYKKCLTPEARHTAFSSACRTAVYPQILAYRISVFGELRNGQVACALSGVFATWDTSHVDHYDPCFEQLVVNFLQAHQIDYLQVPLGGYGDGDVDKWFARQEDAALFSEYHRNVANLRIVSIKANLERSRVRVAWP